MSRSFQYPNNPIPWNGSPRDLTGVVADTPFMGIYTTETTQRYTYGTRHITWDGRVFKYFHAVAECQSGYGARQWSQVLNSAALPAAPATTTAGATTLAVAFETGDGYDGSSAVAKDEWAGGYVVVGNGTEDPDNRGIIGNDAATAAATINVYLDAPLVGTWTGSSSYCEIIPNPYAHVNGGLTVNNDYSSFLGIPTRNQVATYNGWMQTWGPTWITPTGATTSNPGYSANDRMCYFISQNGAIVSGTAATVETGWQAAGFVIERSAASTAGPPFVMLQISI